MRNWSDLDAAEHLVLRQEYQTVLDREPRTCSMDEKVARFAEWLRTRDIAFSAADISRRTPS